MLNNINENDESSLTKRKASGKGYVAVFIIVAVVFGYSLTIRAPHFGALPSNMRYFQVLIDAPIVNNFKEWLENSREGRPNNYILNIIPKSIEYQNDVLRHREIGYFPLFYMPAYILVAALHLEPSLEVLQAYSLTYQFLLTLLVAFLIVFLLSRIVHPLFAVLCAIPAILLLILLPGPMYYFFFTCLPDLNVMPLFVLTVILEMRIDVAEGSKFGWRAAQWIVLFFGILMEWLFAPLAFALVVKRFSLGQLGTGKWEITKKAFYCVLPVGLGLLVFLIYGIANDGLFEIIVRFLNHTSFQDSLHTYLMYFHHIFLIKLPTTLGPFALYLLPLCAGLSFISFGVIASINKFGRETTRKMIQNATLISSSLFLLVTANFIHLIILAQHYDESTFTPVVFLASLTTFYCAFPFMLLSILVARFPKANERARAKLFHPINVLHALVACLLITVSVVWLAKSLGENNKLCLSSTDFCEKFGTKIASLPLEGDVLFSSETPNFTYSMGCQAFVNRIVWPILDNEATHFDVYIKHLLSGKCSLFWEATVPDFLKRPGFFPNILEETWRVPEKFTVGLVLDPDKPIDPKVEPWVAVAEKDLRIGPFRNLVVSSDALRKLYPPDDNKK
jgi:hypothetical protein